MNTIIALFDQIAEAAEAVEAVSRHGVNKENINMVVNDPGGTYADFAAAVRIDADDMEEREHYLPEGHALVLVQTEKYLQDGVRDVLRELGALRVARKDEMWRKGDNLPYRDHPESFTPAPRTREQFVEDFSQFEPQFRHHHETSGEGDFYTALPAYRYGYFLALEESAPHREWPDAEQDFRRRWQAEQAGTWQTHAGAVRFAYDTARNMIQGHGSNVSTGRPYQVRVAPYYEHFTEHYAQAGLPYDHYGEAYRFGELLAEDMRYQDREWTDIAPVVRERWERDHPASGAWSDMEGAIRYAWAANLHQAPKVPAPKQDREGVPSRERE